MKVDYLRLCSRASDNPAFIWFCDFPSIAGGLLCDCFGEPPLFQRALIPFWARGPGTTLKVRGRPVQRQLPVSGTPL